MGVKGLRCPDFLEGQLPVLLEGIRDETERFCLQWTVIRGQLLHPFSSHPTSGQTRLLGDIHLFFLENTAEERKLHLPSYLLLQLSKIQCPHLWDPSLPLFPGHQAFTTGLFLVTPSGVCVHGNSQAELTVLSDSDHSS